MKPINLLYVTAGNGHKIAAMAIMESLDEQKYPRIIIDLLCFSNKLCRYSCSNVYDFVSNHFHAACKLMYKLTNRNRKYSKLVQFIDAVSMKSFERIIPYLKDNIPDISICTHFFPATILAKLKDKGLYIGKIYVIVTDYGLHKMWYNQKVDKYFVPNVQVRDALLKMGASKKQIIISGIPVFKKFQEHKEKEEILKKIGINNSKFTLLVVGSAISDKQVVQLLEGIYQTDMELNVLLVAGRNKGLLKKLESFSSNSWVTLKKYGYIDNIDEMMAIADLMLTKPGGLTVSEAMSIGVPLLMFNPIPYQETNNAAYIAAKGAGVLATSIENAIKLIQKYYTSPLHLEKMRQNAHKIAKPKAAQIIVNTILKDKSL
jgi:processive 1,2-diacylglycerol beta-glucosyltransferase